MPPILFLFLPLKEQLRSYWSCSCHFCTLIFNLFLNRYLFSLFLQKYLHLRLQHIPWRKNMPVVTFFAAVWANPKPTILFLLHCIQKTLANLHTSKQPLLFHKCPRNIYYANHLFRKLNLWIFILYQNLS